MDQSVYNQAYMLSATLLEAQTETRAYDTKAQIVGVGYIFALGVIGQFEVGAPAHPEQNTVTVLLFWLVVVMPVILFGYVLHPTRGTAPALDKGYDEHPKRILFIENEKFETVLALKRAAGQADFEEEYCYEILKISKLRELKRKRFIRGLAAAALSFVFLFSYQLLTFR